MSDSDWKDEFNHSDFEIASDPEVTIRVLSWKLGQAIDTKKAFAERRDVTDAEYRAHRARHGEQVLALDPKLAEWKTKQAYEATDAFVGWKETCAAQDADFWFFVDYIDTCKTVIRACEAMLYASRSMPGARVESYVPTDEQADATRRALRDSRARIGSTDNDQEEN